MYRIMLRSDQRYYIDTNFFPAETEDHQFFIIMKSHILETNYDQFQDSDIKCIYILKKNVFVIILKESDDFNGI